MTVWTMVAAKDAVGAYGERVAARALVDAGMIIVARNWRCTTGEIDIIARDGRTLVFCEVKTRRGDRFGPPVEAVTPEKVRRLRALAATWLTLNPDMRGDVRFDVVSVRPQPSGRAEVQHLRAVF
jgi:putative endonuclease